MNYLQYIIYTALSGLKTNRYSVSESTRIGFCLILSMCFFAITLFTCYYLWAYLHWSVILVLYFLSILGSFFYYSNKITLHSLQQLKRKYHNSISALAARFIYFGLQIFLTVIIITFFSRF